MDSLEAFEKALVAEKEERVREDRHGEDRHRKKHKHRHRDETEHSHPNSNRDGDRERSKRRDRDAKGTREGQGDGQGHGDRDREWHRDRDHRTRRSWRHEDESGNDRRRHKRHRSSRDDEERRAKRRERDDDDDDNLRRSHHYDKQSDPKEDLPAPDDEVPRIDSNIQTSTSASAPLVRDSWMTNPSAVNIDYVQHQKKEDSTLPQLTEDTKPLKSKHALDMSTPDPDDCGGAGTIEEASERRAKYTFGDAGSQWRMTRLKGIYEQAKETRLTVEDVAMKRFGNLQDFDDLREEKEELDRRTLYGQGYVSKEQPTGDLYRERLSKEAAAVNVPDDLEQGVVIPDEADRTTTIPSSAPPGPVTDSTELNRLRARMMKAKLRRAPDAAALEAEYERAAAAAAAATATTTTTTTTAVSNPHVTSSSDTHVVLGAMDSRQLAGQRNEARAVNSRRGRERGLVQENEDMNIDDMVREERRTRGERGGEAQRAAERIARDGRFDTNLDYLDDNAAKLAKRTHRSDVNLKNVAVAEYRALSRALDACPLCHHPELEPPRGPVAPVVALGTRTFLTLAPEPELTPLCAVVAPMAHRTNLLECDDDEWEELRNFMKALTRMYHDLGKDVVFYEDAARPRRKRHAALTAVPVPYEEGATVPAFFREAFLTAGDEWAQHRKVIDTGKAARGGMGRAAFRRSLAREMPYFHVWFDLDGGLGHVVEDEENGWPRGDRFAREVLAGVVDAPVEVVRKDGRWRRGEEGSERVEAFKRRWRRFDWTRVLSEGESGI